MSISVAEWRQTFVDRDRKLALLGSAFFISLLARHNDFLIAIEYVGGLSVFYDSSATQQNRARTKRSHRRQIMRYEQHRRAALLQFLHAAEAAMLKDCVAHGQCFVNQKNFRLDTRGDRKSQSHEHAAGISLYWLIKKLADLCEPFD